jgi:nucleoside-diphosphate-sugar epimerase
MSKLILVTGSAGSIGQAVVRELQSRGLPVRGFDLVPTPGLDDCMVGDITDADVVSQAMQQAEIVVHLAAIPDDDDFLTKLLPNNIIGVYQVFEAARKAGVKRLILGSSGQVVWWQRFTGPLPIAIDAQPTPRAWYAVGKVFLEGAGRAFADSYGMTVIAARLGWCPRTKEHAEELARTEWGPDVYLSPGDAGRFFACAVQSPIKPGFHVVYACSKAVNEQVYDMAAAKDLLGF